MQFLTSKPQFPFLVGLCVGCQPIATTGAQSRTLAAARQHGLCPPVLVPEASQLGLEPGSLQSCLTHCLEALDAAGVDPVRGWAVGGGWVVAVPGRRSLRKAQAGLGCVEDGGRASRQVTGSLSGVQAERRGESPSIRGCPSQLHCRREHGARCGASAAPTSPHRSASH